MDQIRSFKDLRIWQMGMDIVVKVYAHTRGFPKSEIYGLASQMQRAAVSIPSNIAEGHNRPNRREFGQFLSICLGSCAELETQMLIAKELKFIGDVDCQKLVELINSEGRQIRVLISKLGQMQKT
ncbi:MAG TPA: four helix bundle protein [bacterium]